MNKQEFGLVVGVFITIINCIALFCSSFTCIRQFKKAIRNHTKITAVNFHFSLLVTSMALTGANILALHRFFEAWVIDKIFSSFYFILNGFADRIFMCIVSIGLLIISLLKVPFFFKGNDDHP